MFTGVVEVGLFCDMAEAAYFGMEVRPTTQIIESTKLMGRMARS